MAAAKKKSIDDLLSRLNKISKGSATVGDDNFDIPRISSGNILLDEALGGGFAKETIVEIRGPEGSGKSSVATLAAAQAQQEGYVAYIDLENTFNTKNAANHKVKVDELIMVQPSTAEETFEQIEEILREPDISLIVLDSVATLMPKAELEGGYTDANMGVLAKMMGKHFRRVTEIQRQHHPQAILMYINQVRDAMNAMAYGPKTTTPGGRALRFFASQRLEVARVEALKQGDEIIGHKMRVKVDKNKGAPPYKQAELRLLYNSGISNEASIIDLGIKKGVIKKSGAWLTIDDGETTLGQGAEQARLKLVEHPDVAARLLEEIKNAA